MYAQVIKSLKNKFYLRTGSFENCVWLFRKLRLALSKTASGSFFSSGGAKLRQTRNRKWEKLLSMSAIITGLMVVGTVVEVLAKADKRRKEEEKQKQVQKTRTTAFKERKRRSMLFRKIQKKHELNPQLFDNNDFLESPDGQVYMEWVETNEVPPGTTCNCLPGLKINKLFSFGLFG